MSALIAGGFAATHPDTLTRVALVNGGFRRSSAARDAVEQRAGQIGAGAFDLETQLSRWFGDSTIEQASCHKIASWLRQVDLGGYATAYGAFARGDTTYADQLSQIPYPF